MNETLMIILHCLLNNSKEFSKTDKNVANGLASLQLIMRTVILKMITKVMLEKETKACQRCLGLALHVEETSTVLLDVLTQSPLDKIVRMQ